MHKKGLEEEEFTDYCFTPDKTFELNIPNKACLVIGLQTNKVCCKSKSEMAYSRPAIQFKACSNKNAKKIFQTKSRKSLKIHAVILISWTI